MFKPSTDELNAICLAVGQIVLPWSQIEMALDITVSVIFHQGAGKKFTSQQGVLPRGFKRKIGFLHEAFRELPLIMPIQAEAEQLLGKAAGLNGIRQFIIHGVTTAYDTDKKLVTFTKLDPEGEIHWESVQQYTIDKLLERGQQCLDLSTTILHFNERVCEALGA